jgi:hypothetical protein
MPQFLPYDYFLASPDCPGGTPCQSDESKSPWPRLSHGDSWPTGCVGKNARFNEFSRAFDFRRIEFLM